MLSVDLALRLRTLGLHWDPRAGDRFVIAGRGMDEEVFTLSDMVAEVHDYPAGREIGFNGTTEWALDSVEQRDAVWLPREDQLRERLGTSFRSLERTPTGYRVVVAGAGGRPVEAPDPAEAYGLALLDLLARTDGAARA